MTLTKSALLGSAAAIVTVVAAQAADLPTHKAAPVAQSVKICDVGGITGWTLPGSDTCFKISGYITGQFTGGNLSSQYNWAGSILSTQAQALNPFAPASTNQTILVQGGDREVPITNAITGHPILSGGTQLILPNQQNATFNRSSTGFSTRANVTFDTASKTAYGPLLAHIEVQTESGSGFQPVTNLSYLNLAYLSWAGITAGVSPSFYAFTAGGDAWNNFLSPDRKGFNQPNLFAYTASFGDFSATISAESQFSSSGPGTNMDGTAGANPGAITFGGTRWPDIVGALHVKQGWGEAQISGVIHNVNVKDYTYDGAAGCGYYGGVCDGSESKVGWGIDAGVKFNLPWAEGDNVLVTGAYAQNATWYSGMGGAEMMWGESGQIGGNGQPMYLADAYFNPLTNQWSTPRAWSVTALLEHHWTPTIYTDLEGSVGGINWSNMNGANCTTPGACFGTGVLSPKALTWIVGGDIGWNPVTNLNFDVELMYQSTHQDQPSGFAGTVTNTGLFVPGAWEGTSSGFASRLRITRYF